MAGRAPAREPAPDELRTLVTVLADLELTSRLVREPELLQALRSLGSLARRREVLRWATERLLVLSETRTAIDRASGRTHNVDVFRLNRVHPEVRRVLVEGW